MLEFIAWNVLGEEDLFEGPLAVIFYVCLGSLKRAIYGPHVFCNLNLEGAALGLRSTSNRRGSLSWRAVWQLTKINNKRPIDILDLVWILVQFKMYVFEV